MICKVHVETQEHLLVCQEIKKHIEIPEDIHYDDIFDNDEKQQRIVKIFKMILRKRGILMNI